MSDNVAEKSVASVVALLLEKNMVTSLDQVHDLIDRLTPSSRQSSDSNTRQPVAAPKAAPSAPAQAPAQSYAKDSVAPAAAPAPKAAAPQPEAPKAPRPQAPKAAAPKAPAKVSEAPGEARPAPVAQGKRPAPGSSAAFRDADRLKIEDGRVVTAREMGQAPFCNPRDSVKGEFLVCLEDGRELKMLKRHLRAAYGMTPEQYKEKWELPSDYPVVSPDYSMAKSNYARAVGLGTSAVREEKKARQTETA